MELSVLTKFWTSSLAGLAENGQAFNRINTSCKCELVLVDWWLSVFFGSKTAVSTCELRINRN